ncbi:sushi domain-containing protein 2-like [Physella acuta]|uniref:sushi domain-containing protein 2-like n=1 Tax=Physella acuta TaxID=109671 RepID=UPI0027DBA6F0|nr:sushi domain-containing protein 2-like [Physella acuta]XP_059177945.1 sushi domain-containing protein 2-like [Physella acuta]XP_059177946.1 sushi domain-containing protein 2-like [Physella acuta]
MCACLGSTHLVTPQAATSAPLQIFIRLFALSLCTLLVKSPCLAVCVDVSKFFPFGAAVGDRMTPRTDDGSSGAINLTVHFPFFGWSHDKLYVNNNGVVSFKKELVDFKPLRFPLEDETPLIAPFWADVDISPDGDNGTVWYRESKDPEILAKATQEIRQYHSAFKNFRAFWVFIATWEEVGFFGAESLGRLKRNTFQAVLVLDATGRQSFIILNYAKIEWTTGSNSGADVHIGLGGIPAQAGFNAGDRTNFYEIDGANTEAVINLTETSNLGIPGKWIFRIDSSHIETGCSLSTSGEVYPQPAYSSMLGGVTIGISGPCLNSTSDIQGQLQQLGQDLCCYVEGEQARCILPPVFDTGVLTILLNVDGRGWNYSGKFEIKNVMDVPAEITRKNPEDWRTGVKVSVNWSEPYFNASEYLIEILVFKNDNASLISVYNKSFEPPSSREYELEMPPSSVFSGFTVAVVRISAASLYCNNTRPAIYSDVFPVRFSRRDSEKLCSDWLLKQSSLPPLDLTGICPCTLRQAEGDTAQFSTDPFCYSWSSSPLNCQYRSKAAVQCISPNHVSEYSSTYLCCYDKKSSELLNAFAGNGGGTVQLYNYRQRRTVDDDSIVPYFTYMEMDLVPYLHCCDFSSNQTLCNQYLGYRQPVGCKGYAPPAAAQAAGDPHIETLDRLSYTFNGVGEYILLRVKDTDTVVQVKASQALDEKGVEQNATVFTAMALNSSGQRLEIRAESLDLVALYVNTVAFDLSTPMAVLEGMTIYKNQTQNDSVELTIVLEQTGLSLLVEATTEKLLNIMVMAGSQLKGKLEGLLGNFNGDPADDLMASDGRLLSPEANMRDIHFNFGLTWEVPANTSLFTRLASDMEESNLADAATNQSYVPVFVDEIVPRRNDTSVLCGKNLQCMYDYELTGKKSIAMSTLKFNERYEERLKEIEPVTRCDYVPGVENGNFNISGQKVNDTVVVECDEGFVVNGTVTVLKCLPNGQWSSSLPSCYRVPIKAEETFPLIYIAVGAASGGFVLVVLVVFAVRLTWGRNKPKPGKDNQTDQSSDCGHSIELPTIFPISDIPSPVFENPLFLSSLQKLSEKGSFHIPRPTYVDPNIYSEYF